MLVVPMLVTLWHLSQHSVLHGDIKPENIFMSDGQAFLGDFGFSRRLFVRVCDCIHCTHVMSAVHHLASQHYLSSCWLTCHANTIPVDRVS